MSRSNTHMKDAVGDTDTAASGRSRPWSGIGYAAFAFYCLKGLFWLALGLLAFYDARVPGTAVYSQSGVGKFRARRNSGLNSLDW